MAKAKIDYAELCDVIRIKITSARTANSAPDKRKGKYLSEAQTDVVAPGSQDGDPRSGEGRRSLEIDGAYERGTVKVPVKGDKGRTKLTDVPATEANVRAALEYWRTRKPRSDASREAQNKNVSDLQRRLRAMVKGKSALHASESPEGRTQHMLPGPALVQGPNMEAVDGRPTRTVNGVTEFKSPVLGGALTERLDRTVADERPQARRTPSQRKNWRRKQQRIALQAENAALKAQLAAK
jgi:hypothetical protein